MNIVIKSCSEKPFKAVSGGFPLWRSRLRSLGAVRLSSIIKKTHYLHPFHWNKTIKLWKEVHLPFSCELLCWWWAALLWISGLPPTERHFQFICFYGQCFYHSQVWVRFKVVHTSPTCQVWSQLFVSQAGQASSRRTPSCKERERVVTLTQTKRTLQIMWGMSKHSFKCNVQWNLFSCSCKPVFFFFDIQTGPFWRWRFRVRWIFPDKRKHLFDSQTNSLTDGKSIKKGKKSNHTAPVYHSLTSTFTLMTGQPFSLGFIGVFFRHFAIRWVFPARRKQSLYQQNICLVPFTASYTTKYRCEWFPHISGY